MKLINVLKKIGVKAIQSNPAGSAALTLINTFLPKGKQLTGEFSGEEAISHIHTSMSPEHSAELLDSQIELAKLEEEGRTERYVAMTKADGQETRAKIVDKAMNALIALSLIFIAAVAFVYAKDGAESAFSYEMAAVFFAVSGTFSYVIRAYFGDLRTETESRHQVEDDKPRLPKGLAGLIASMKGKG
jgi:uncharacterized membrane protein